MDRTWKPTVGGILAIIAGVALGIIAAEVFAFPARFLTSSPHRWWTVIAFVVGAVFVILGITAIVGGIYALRRRRWGLALAGAMCALPAGFLPGILAIIFVIRGREEFE